MSIVQIVNGDCLTVLKALPDACFASVVTDPPAGIGFMGKAWDGDTGGASRFFYVAKPSTKERNAGLEGFPDKVAGIGDDRPSGQSMQRLDGRESRVTKNTHPTVKPIALMRYLCRLITPPGGIVLDPFCGSGTTGCAAVLGGFGFVGIEMDAEHVATAEARIAHWAATVQEEAA